MKALSASELKLAEEMFSSTAKIVSMIQFQEMDQEKLKRYEDFFISRYKTLIGCNACLVFIRREFYYRLSTDQYYACVVDNKTTFPKGRNYEDCYTFEECLMMAKGIFKENNYKQFYSNIFENAYNKSDVKDLNNNPAHMVRGVVSNCVLTLCAFNVLYHITNEEWDIMKGLQYSDEIFHHKMIYYSEYTEESNLFFSLFSGLFDELEKLYPECVSFEDKKEETA